MESPAGALSSTPPRDSKKASTLYCCSARRHKQQETYPQPRKGSDPLLPKPHCTWPLMDLPAGVRRWSPEKKKAFAPPPHPHHSHPPLSPPHTLPQTPQHHPPPPPHQHKSSPLITTDQVRGQLRKLRPRKAAGPDKVCPRLLKTCAAELGEPLQWIFNLSLQIGRVPTLWKTSRIVPVPKKNRPSELNDFRPVALTSHLMKTLERLFLSLLRPQVQHAQDRLQFAYQPGVGVEDAILYLLHRAQPPLLRDKLSRMGVDPQLMDWISDYLTGRPQYVGLKDIKSDTVVSSTGAPQGTVLAPLLFTLI
ncbi:hypothetical protein L3Q82_016681 [Scortum barcoo]|uniref:Uncharacterized protein n=1 Tax=Scortum barcoo TaxID=214431 RepID=A0ACB8X7Y8_9TELE|nr:hypothetical protein L3Q82_016681 [Scortum barcoo]